MQKFIYLAIVLLCTQKMAAQSRDVLTLNKVSTLRGSIVGFSADNLGSLYVINSSNQIKKYNDKGDSIAVYNDVRRYGNIFLVDAANPLKLLVYYRDYATIVVLDRMLNVRNTIDLRKQNIYQAQAVCTSYDGNFWVYDELAGKIRKLDDLGRVMLESTDLRMALPEPPQPVSIFDRDGELYLYDTLKGVFVFDYYGALKKKIPLTGVSDLQVIDKNTITGRRGDQVILYRPATFQTFTYPLQQTAIFNRIQFNGNRLYALTSQQQIEIFLTP